MNLHQALERVEAIPIAGCWIWTGRADSDGYGRLIAGPRQKSVRAPRYFYEQFVGTIPPRTLVLHRCDVPACVNPHHLFLGDHDANMQDRRNKGRVPRGERLANSKLTREQVARIKSAAGSDRDIAATFGIARSTVWRIRSGKFWKHVPAAQLR